MNRKKCEFCGEYLSKNDTFCKSCGNSIKNSKHVQDAIIDDPKGNINNKKDNNYLIIVISILAILILIGLLI